MILPLLIDSSKLATKSTNTPLLSNIILECKSYTFPEPGVLANNNIFSLISNDISLRLTDGLAINQTSFIKLLEPSS